uniref:SWIM-type domain-containing protein n=1 Tax=Chlamydomonas leiostraca TaxID=1034604 RepID=A0A7S0WTZ8_9CHLO
MPPRKKAAPVVDLTADDEDELLVQAKPKRGRKRKADAVGDAGDDDGAGPSTSQPTQTQKKGRAKKEPKPEPEKRVDRHGYTVTYRPTCSFQVQQRIDRALSTGAGAAHRLFLLGTQQVTPRGAPGGGEQEFTVLGATGNVYTVHIGRHPRCTCPDFEKGNLCKHVLFCHMRVLGRARTDPLIWQRALLSAEADEVLAALGDGGGVDQAALANERTRARWAQMAGGAQGGAGLAAPGASPAPKQRPVEGDCPICYEAMASGPGAEAVVFCATCGNNCHQSCFSRWSSAKRGGGLGVTCVWCRAPWGVGAGDDAPGSQSQGGSGRYVNLAEGGGPSMYDLYRGSAAFINAHATGRGLGAAINSQRAYHGY